MMPGIIISCFFNEQGKLIFRAAPLEDPAALPALISISNSANRSSPRAWRFFALRADFAATRER
jgi:hypothetical protein